MTAEQMRYAAQCVRQALAALEQPDPRLVAAVDVAERRALGQATIEELAAARDALREPRERAYRSLEDANDSVIQEDDSYYLIVVAEAVYAVVEMLLAEIVDARAAREIAARATEIAAYMAWIRAWRAAAGCGRQIAWTAAEEAFRKAKTELSSTPPVGQ